MKTKSIADDDGDEESMNPQRVRREYALLKSHTSDMVWCPLNVSPGRICFRQNPEIASHKPQPQLFLLPRRNENDAVKV